MKTELGKKLKALRQAIIDSGVQLVDWDELPSRDDERSIWEVIDEIMADIPDEEWDKLPSDLSSNLDHYLYGTPKDRDR